MLILTKGQISYFYCTPAENSDENYSDYYITFTNRITQSIIQEIYNNTSPFERYQQFTIDTSIFVNEDTGFWTYEIKAWDSEPVGPVLESGFMYLNPEIAFEPTKYDEQNNSFITYNG